MRAKEEFPLIPLPIIEAIKYSRKVTNAISMFPLIPLPIIEAIRGCQNLHQA